MISAAAYNLRHAFNPHGRDGRKVFWKHFLFVVLLNLLCAALIMVPAFGSLIGDISANSNALEASELEAALLRDMAQTGLAKHLAQLGLGLGVMNIVLLSASIIRRCHDANLPGIILMVPLALQLIWMFFAFGQLSKIDATIERAAQARAVGQSATIDPAMIAQDMLGWIVVLIVILIGLAKSQPGPSRYGEGPVVL